MGWFIRTPLPFILVVNYKPKVQTELLEENEGEDGLWCETNKCRHKPFVEA